MKLISKKRNIKRSIFAIGLVAMVLCGGSIWHTIMEEREAGMCKFPGELFNVNSHNMHLYTLGDGKPTVVFIAGSGTPNAYTDFYYLQNELQQYTKTLSFDHAGFGWSEKTSIPRTVDNLVSDLNKLLKNSNQTPPYTLIAHSLASLEAIRYAQLYPEEVKSIVFLDAGSPQYYVNGIEIESFLLNRFCAMLRVTGINRALGNAGIKLPFAGEDIRYSSLPDDIKKVEAAMYCKFLGSNNNRNVIKHINENAKTVLENGNLHDIPILILSSDSGSEWEEVQFELSSWSNISTSKMIKNSRHYLHWSHKETVVSEIVKFIE